MKFHNGIHAIQFPDQRVEICAGMETLLCFPHLGEKLWRILKFLELGSSRSDLRQRAQRLDLEWKQVEELLQHLKRAELLDCGKAARRGTEDSTWMRLGGATLRAAYRNRKFLKVAFNTDTDLSVGLAGHLAAGGIGTICFSQLRDLHPSRAKHRVTELRQQLTSQVPAVKLVGNNKDSNLWINLNWGSINPIEVHHAMRQGVPFLSIVFGHDHVEVGPLTIPGITPCPNCIARHRQDRISDLTERVSSLLQVPFPHIESSLGRLGCAVASAQILSYLDQRASHPGRVTRIDIDGQTHNFDYHPDPNCGCCALLLEETGINQEFVSAGPWVSSWESWGSKGEASASSWDCVPLSEVPAFPTLSAVGCAPAVASPSESAPGSRPLA